MIINSASPPTPSRMKLIPSSYGATQLVAGCRWPCTEGQGTTITDVAADLNAANGTLTNGPTWNADSTRGTCVQLDGVDDYIEIDSSAAFLDGTRGSMMGWVYVTATGQLMFMSYGKNGNANVGLSLGIDSSGYIFARYKVGGTNFKATSSVSDSSIQNVWTHVGMTWVFQSYYGTGTTTCYINGTADGTATHTSTWNSLDQGKIGDTAVQGGSSIPMTGKVQNFASSDVSYSASTMANASANGWGMIAEVVTTTNKTLAVYNR